ncbi:hypothetical protein AC624_05310 [Bacillus sp. FJAT-27238]|nr:hypothetical protein AC624_05310 [Bacillus sp. FJAT-27238]
MKLAEKQEGCDGRDEIRRIGKRRLEEDRRKSIGMVFDHKIPIQIHIGDGFIHILTIGVQSKIAVRFERHRFQQILLRRKCYPQGCIESPR